MGSLHPGWCGYNSALGLRVNVSIDPLTATIAELSCYARSSRWRQTARRTSHPDCMSIQRRKSASEGHESLDHVPYRPPHTLPCYRSWRLLLKSRNSRTGLLARATISCLPPILNRKQRMWAPVWQRVPFSQKDRTSAVGLALLSLSCDLTPLATKHANCAHDSSISGVGTFE